MESMPGVLQVFNYSGSGLVEGVAVGGGGCCRGTLIKKVEEDLKKVKKGFLILSRMRGSKPLNEYLEARTVIFICSNCSAKTGRCSTCHRERRRCREGENSILHVLRLRVDQFKQRRHKCVCATLFDLMFCI